MKKIISNLSPKIDFISGSVVAYYKKCNRANCKCSQGYLHGPYFYRFWRHEGKRFKQYVRKEDVAVIKAACKNYQEQKRADKEIQLKHLTLWRKLKAQLNEVISNE
jgi:predicted GIY-YIG superfamily endonuclease